MRRVLALLAGLVLAGAALYALLTGTALPRTESPGPPASNEPTAEIDEASRRQLDAVLREAGEEP